MKKQSVIFIFLFLFVSCFEDESVDITVLPEETTVGAHTFGCLIDGWIYVGGRYSDWDISSINFWYYQEDNQVDVLVKVKVKEDTYITFEIPDPIEGRQTSFTGFKFQDESFEDGIVSITRFDKENQIISGRFEGGRITHGRFDVKLE